MPAEGWTNPAFDASSWATDTAPFSDRRRCTAPTRTATSVCRPSGNTDFPIGGSIFLRNSFALPAYAWGLHLTGTIDNYASLWVNGSSYGSANGGSCSTGDISVDVPNASLQRGATSNLVAVNASDDGSTATYFALQATYGAIAFGNQPVETQQNSPITDGSGPIRVTITPPAGGAAVPDGTESRPHAPGDLGHREALGRHGLHLRRRRDLPESRGVGSGPVPARRHE